MIDINHLLFWLFRDILRPHLDMSILREWPVGVHSNQLSSLTDNEAVAQEEKVAA
jgi:hypothetical protein